MLNIRSIFLLFTLITLSFATITAQHFIDKRQTNAVSGLTITKPDEATPYNTTYKIVIRFCADKDLTHLDSISLYKANGNNLNFVYVFQSNIAVKLTSDNNNNKCQAFTYNVPNVTPDAQYVINIAFNKMNINSGSFLINNPGFGLVITKPKTGQITTCGSQLDVQWVDLYNLYQNAIINSIFLKTPTGTTTLTTSNVPASSGKYTVTLPNGLQNSQGYNIALQVTRDNNTETYYSDTFTIRSC
ncbi:7024_t:CDS:2 [Cetraspora pellucida]|uniref:7024_t:CDS:1 n=1 Tax=Cetraspora pellucida TaxID=1433469 RepID=A0A9N9I1P1_9GLOM|nr:7024_t:CDS:2 [Cetraspora pellucida]